jgi:mRNA-degrading endonuclease RelE of RelBE toxin-antitoxin system
VGENPSALVWSRETFQVFQKLPAKSRREIRLKIHTLRFHPRMYQVQNRGRWRGMRRFFTTSWRLYYVFWEPANTIYIEGIEHAQLLFR